MFSWSKFTTHTTTSMLTASSPQSSDYCKWYKVRNGFGFIICGRTKMRHFVHRTQYVRIKPEQSVHSVGERECFYSCTRRACRCWRTSLPGCCRRILGCWDYLAWQTLGEVSSLTSMLCFCPRRPRRSKVVVSESNTLVLPRGLNYGSIWSHNHFTKKDLL